MARLTGYLYLDLRSLCLELSGVDSPDMGVWLQKGGVDLLSLATRLKLFTPPSDPRVWPLFLEACALGEAPVIEWCLSNFSPGAEVKIAGFERACGSEVDYMAEWLWDNLELSRETLLRSTARPMYFAARAGNVTTGQWLTPTFGYGIGPGTNGKTTPPITAFEAACLEGRAAFVNWALATFHVPQREITAPRQGEHFSLFANLALMLKLNSLKLLARKLHVRREDIIRELQPILYHQGSNQTLVDWLANTFG